MPQPSPISSFGEEHAASYDTHFAKLAVLKDALHLCARAVLAELPSEARILCVGAGTGAELLYLAEAFPGWRFALVDPAPAMLNRCRQKAVEAGIENRCEFHAGYLESLPASAPFDAATAILVSQFVLDDGARRQFFSEIAARLQSGGLLISADLASHSDAALNGLFEAWMQLMLYNGLTSERLAQYRAAMQSGVAIRAPEEVETIMAAGGFRNPTRFCQTLLIHAWCARRAD